MRMFPVSLNSKLKIPPPALLDVESAAAALLADGRMDEYILCFSLSVNPSGNLVSKSPSCCERWKSGRRILQLDDEWIN